MANDVEEKEVKPSRRKSDKELLDTDNELLNTDELVRKSTLIDLQAKLHNQKLVRHQIDQFEMKASETRDKFLSRGRELKKTENDQKKHQANCSHRKGGRGLEAIQKGGNASDYAVIRHLLPNNEWWQRCQRCGKTWKPPHREAFDDDAAGKAAFDAANAEYKEALNWPTDNIPSTGITFQHHSDDGDVSAREFVQNVFKDTTLR